MKFLICLIALAIVVAVSAADAAKPVIPEYEAQRGIPYTTLYTLGTLTPEKAQAELDKVKAIVTESNKTAAKASFAMAETVIYIKTNEITKFSQIEKKYKEALADVKAPEYTNADDKDVVQRHLIAALSPWYAGGYSFPKLEAVMRECYDEFRKEPAGPKSSIELGYRGLDLGDDLENVIPLFSVNIEGKHALLRRLIDTHRVEAAAPIFWELVVAGNLTANECAGWYSTVLSSEVSKPDFDAAALKSNINRAILVYKTKARLWKGKEGEKNPFLLCVGMMQDTLKDLE